MSFQVTNKVVIVTGGSSGIGLELVRLFLSEGAKVAWCGRNSEKLKSSYDALSKEYDKNKMFIYQCDVLNAEQVADFVQSVLGRFSAIDMLVNNAGQGKVADFFATEEQDWVDELKLKVFSVVNMINAALPSLKKSDIASITNVNSLLGLKPETHMVATSVARAGLLNLSKNLANELVKDNVRVNSILIGLVESGQWQRRFEERSDTAKTWEDWTSNVATKKGIPLGRLGKPEEAAYALMFLASPLSSYTTGSVIDVSGGLSKEI
ncbi:SDR family oxidoreductase [Psychrobacter celer]|uniref:SDR family oxidoreductase n=1 Tax=Psychrobacter celer TaxID=306572 RepID=UPI001866B2AF|nr:SDR family oxidoreductase [Psychrobacter celer]